MKKVMKLYHFFLVFAVITLVYGCQRKPPSTQVINAATSEETMHKLLKEFGEAWNRHDLDAIMLMMTNDCVFEASGGDNINGGNIKGKKRYVRLLQPYLIDFPMPSGVIPSIS
jgi:hypothetical protein